MKLGIRFTPPAGMLGGSQRTVANHTIPALARLHPDFVLFTSNRAAFPTLPADRIVDVFPQLSIGSRTRTALGLVRNYAGFGAEVRHAGCDVVYYPYTLEALHRVRGFAQAVTVHDMLPLVYPRMYPRTVRLWRHLLLPHLRNTASIIVPSVNTREGLIAQGGFDRRRIHVVPQGFASFPQSEPDALPAVPFLLYVSSSHYPYKNIPFLLRAFEEAAAHLPHRLIIVGTPHSRFTPELLALRAASAVGDRVEFLHEVTSERLRDLYRQATMFVYPSEFEGFGIPPLEAMASGIPVAAMNAASIPEVCGDAALYFQPGQHATAAAAMLSLVQDDRLRAEYIARGRDRVSRFDWNRTAAGVLRACDAALEDALSTRAVIRGYNP